MLFPLFSAEGEVAWVPGWTYENVMGSAELHENYVFVTRGDSHDHAASDAIWIVKRHEPENFLVHFYKVEPDDKVGVVEVQCIEIGDSQTHIEVTYEYIGMSAAADKFIRGFTADDYREFIAQWKTFLEDYSRQADS